MQTISPPPAPDEVSVADPPGGPSPTREDIPVVHVSGVGALLFNPGGAAFQLHIQQRLWSLKHLLDADGSGLFLQVVLGVNNALVMFDPHRLRWEDAERRLRELWLRSLPEARLGKQVVIPVVYGGSGGEDLGEICGRLEISAAQFAHVHSNAEYTVACLGSMAGFGYLVGLPPQLATPRRPVPRLKVPKGSVMIGGTQAGVQPVTAPSGWHLVGTTQTVLFDPGSASPCLLHPGDRVRFEIAGVQA